MKIDESHFEVILIFKCLTDEIYLASVVDNLKPEYFRNKDIKNIFEIIVEYFTKRNKPPTLTEIKSYLVSDELKKSFKNVVAQFTGIDQNLDKDELYANTEIFLKEKAVYHTLMEVIGIHEGGKEIDTSLILNKFEKACSINLHNDIGLDLFNNIDELVKFLKLEQPFIKSGWKWLDEKLGGGFFENGRALYVFAGETNIGKSIFLGNIADNIAKQGKTVLLITLEMPEMIYAQRICTKTTKIPISDLRTEAETLRTAINQYKTEIPGARILIKEFPPSTITPNQLKAYIKKIISSGIKIDAIVLDYLGLLTSTVGTNSYERLKHVSEQVRAMSYVFNCPIISAVQLNRQAFNQAEPGLETVAESTGISSTADVMCSIYQDDSDKELGLISLGIMKNRYGMRNVTQKMKIDYKTLSITEDAHVNDTEAGISSINILNTLSN